MLGGILAKMGPQETTPVSLSFPLYNMKCTPLHVYLACLENPTKLKDDVTDIVTSQFHWLTDLARPHAGGCQGGIVLLRIFLWGMWGKCKQELIQSNAFHALSHSPNTCNLFPKIFTLFEFSGQTIPRSIQNSPILNPVQGCVPRNITSSPKAPNQKSGVPRT